MTLLKSFFNETKENHGTSNCYIPFLQIGYGTASTSAKVKLLFDAPCNERILRVFTDSMTYDFT